MAWPMIKIVYVGVSVFVLSRLVLVWPASFYSASPLKHHATSNAVMSQTWPLSWLWAGQSVSNSGERLPTLHGLGNVK